MATPSFSKLYTGPPSVSPYPPPLARYEDLVSNSKLFMSTLEKFHSAMGTKFMIPIIGGKELNLHRLFMEVTSRGGIEKIIRERKWKEITAVFNFPSTATNASFVLRKYYGSLLHHYEQLYFFNAQGWIPFTSGSFPPIQQNPSPIQPSPEQLAATYHQRAPASESRVVGVIDGKFDGGYLVTVTVGAEKLRGVLYETILVPVSGKKMKKRKKNEATRIDLQYPKPNRSGYNFFFAEQHARLKPLHPGKEREISRMIGELWNNLKEDEKRVFQETAAKDKERYLAEMDRYRERQMGVVSDAVPLLQWAPGHDNIESSSSGSLSGSPKGGVAKEDEHLPSNPTSHNLGPNTDPPIGGQTG